MPVLCLCHSGKTYENCCKPFHDGISLPSALLLMRSRYSGYAFHRPDYIIRTTHPHNPNFQQNVDQWTQDILQFCLNTDFEGLDILSFNDEGEKSYVTFIAHLKQNGQDATFGEKSLFEKIENRWLYRDGTRINLRDYGNKK